MTGLAAGFSRQYACLTGKAPFRESGFFMDEFDALLLSLLRRDARAPVVTLAHSISLSRSATQARIARLIEQGHIRGFTIVEGGKAAQTAHFFIKLRSGYKCAQVVPKLKKEAGVLSINSIAGAFDILIKAEAQTMEGIESLRSTMVEIAGISDVTTMMVLERHLN